MTEKEKIEINNLIGKGNSDVLKKLRDMIDHSTPTEVEPPSEENPKSKWTGWSYLIGTMIGLAAWIVQTFVANPIQGEIDFWEKNWDDYHQITTDWGVVWKHLAEYNYPSVGFDTSSRAAKIKYIYTLSDLVDLSFGRRQKLEYAGLNEAGRNAKDKELAKIPNNWSCNEHNNDLQQKEQCLHRLLDLHLLVIESEGGDITQGAKSLRNKAMLRKFNLREAKLSTQLSIWILTGIAALLIGLEKLVESFNFISSKKHV